MSGLALLTGNYTDSEDEDQNRDAISDDENNPDSTRGFTASGPGSNVATTNATPNSEVASARSTPSQGGRKPALNLVSYGDIQDENDDKDVENVPMELESDEESKDESTGSGLNKSGGSAENNESGVLNRSNSVVVDAWTGGGRLPDEPHGKCSEKLQDSVNKLYKRKLERGYDLNRVIQFKKEFRNPSIYEKLIQFCEIDETGTNLPKDLYDGHLFGKESYYDELAKVQKLDMEKREKAAKERNAKIEHSKEELAAKVAATKPGRKSKWDQGPGVQPPIAKTIPAFGALPKK